MWIMLVLVIVPIKGTVFGSFGAYHVLIALQSTVCCRSLYYNSLTGTVPDSLGSLAALEGL